MYDFCLWRLSALSKQKNIGSMVGQRRKRWANIAPALGHFLVFTELLHRRPSRVIIGKGPLAINIKTNFSLTST